MFYEEGLDSLILILLQVHRAVLSEEMCRLTRAPDGLEVAVKVRHPRVKEVMIRDFNIMEALAHSCSTQPWAKRLRLQVLTEF